MTSMLSETAKGMGRAKNKVDFRGEFGRDDQDKLYAKLIIEEEVPPRNPEEPPYWETREIIFAGAGAGGRFMKKLRELVTKLG